MTFDYDVFAQRNIGFVSASEQQRLRASRIFVCGVGGMGGAAFMALVRAGVAHFVIADFDRFEMSNLNRQVFAFVDELGHAKADAAAEAARRINPEVEVEVMGPEWVDRLADVAHRCPIIINGMDDVAAGIHLYRTAREARATVIDAYMAPLPSVTVVRPQDPRPEERFRLPTRRKAWTEITADDKRAAMLAEIEHVMLHSSSRHHVDLTIAAEVAAGRRSRMSFAPMVITTGMLMAYEAIALALERPSATDFRGWFLNAHGAVIERPRSAVLATLLRPLIRRSLARMISAA